LNRQSVVRASGPARRPCAGVSIWFLRGDGAARQGDIVSNLTDAAWALSMLWMEVVGITVGKAKRLSGRQCFAPLLRPFWLLIAIVASVAFGDMAGCIMGFGRAVVLWNPVGLSRRAKRRCALVRVSASWRFLWGGIAVSRSIASSYTIMKGRRLLALPWHLALAVRRQGVHAPRRVHKRLEDSRVRAAIQVGAVGMSPGRPSAKLVTSVL
jgi:hypothetical protein